MTFFLSYECSAPANAYFSKLEPLFSQKLQCLRDNDYGHELRHISIISIVVSDEFMEFRTERKLFSRKTNSADIRLNIDFRAFVKASPVNRYELYVSHILSSIETLRKKVSREYEFDRLISDVKELLGSEDLRTACAEIKRYS